MRGVTIIVAGTNVDRFRAALNLLATQAALSGRGRLFLEGTAVALIGAEDDPPAGMPPLVNLIDTALDLGAEIILCQSGLAATGLDLSGLDPRIQGGGLTTLLAGLGDDRLIAF